MVLLEQAEEQHCSLRFHCGTGRESCCPLKASQFTAIYGCPNRTLCCLEMRRDFAHLLLPRSSRVRSKFSSSELHVQGAPVSLLLDSIMRSPAFMQGMGWDGLSRCLAWASGKYVSPLTRGALPTEHLPPCPHLEIKHPYTLRLTGSWV